MSTLELKKKTPCLYTENRWQASSFALKVINFNKFNKNMNLVWKIKDIFVF